MLKKFFSRWRGLLNRAFDERHPNMSLKTPDRRRLLARVQRATTETVIVLRGGHVAEVYSPSARYYLVTLGRRGRQTATRVAHSFAIRRLPQAAWAQVLRQLDLLHTPESSTVAAEICAHLDGASGDVTIVFSPEQLATVAPALARSGVREEAPCEA